MACVAAWMLLFAAGEAGAGAADMKIEGLTFVASRGSSNRLVLRAENATLGRGSDAAELEGVVLVISPNGDLPGLSVRCRRGHVLLDSGDFRLEGNLQGEFDDGRVLEVAWVRYDDAKGLLYSDAPVRVTEQGASYRAGGFRYRVRKGELRLLGGVEVVRGR